MENSQKAIIGVYAVVVMTVVAFAAFFLYGKLSNSSVAFAVPELDSTAVFGEPVDAGDDAGYKTIALGDDLTIAMNTNLVADDSGAVNVDFTSAGSNESWVRMLITDSAGNELGSTGILKPGQYVCNLSLDLSEFGDERPIDAVLKVLTYEPDTYYSEGSASASVTIY